MMNERERIKISFVISLFLILIGIGNTLAADSDETMASVYLYGEKTDVTLGENILIKLSTVNLITNPVMYVQAIIIPPSGMSVTSSEFSKSGAGQFTTNYKLKPGEGKDIEVRIKSNQIGNFNVSGRIIYYFGNDTKSAGDYSLKLPIKVKANTPVDIKDDIYTKKSGVQGVIFTIAMVFIIILLAYFLVRKMAHK